jgi:hypothetical protein
MSVFSVLLSSKIAASALTAGVVAVGGTGAAAYTGVLPEPAQQAAHQFIGAPAPADAELVASAEEDDVNETEETELEETEQEESEQDGEGAAKDGASSVDAAGPAAFGLCEAFGTGKMEGSSRAYESLVTAAEGEDNISAYCESVPAPGQSAERREAAAQKRAAAADKAAAARAAGAAARDAARQNAAVHGAAAPQVPAPAAPAVRAPAAHAPAAPATPAHGGPAKAPAGHAQR